VCAEQCSVLAGESFVAFTEATIGTRPALFVDGLAVVVPMAVVNGLVEFYLPGLSSVGPHTLEIRATTARTDPLTLTVTAPPPSIDPCIAEPLTFQVRRWPSWSTGRRSLEYTTNRPVQIVLDVRNSLWRATATDARGCQILQTR
jgi:hypothetical protein